MHDNIKKAHIDNIKIVKDKKSRPLSSPSPSILSINSSINELR